MSKYASNFFEIGQALKDNANLRDRTESLIKEKWIVGKALDGGSRRDEFRLILIDLISGTINLEESYYEVTTRLGANNSAHGNDRRVFPTAWEERLVRTNLSKFYNQAVLTELSENGSDRCLIPYSEHEKPDSPCSQVTEGEHSVQLLLSRLVKSYEEGEFNKELKIPNHPHCTHVVAPVKSYVKV